MRWLGLPAAPHAPRGVAADTNQKYEAEYCDAHLATPRQRQSHCVAAAALQPYIGRLGLGYDLRSGGADGFGCIRGALLQRPDATDADAGPEDACEAVNEGRVADPMSAEGLARLEGALKRQLHLQLARLPPDAGETLAESLVCGAGET